MDFSFTEKQLQFKREVQRFAAELALSDADPPDDSSREQGRQNTAAAGMVARDSRSEFSRAAWDACAKFGIHGLSLPEEFSGTPAVEFLTAVLAMEALGAAFPDLGLLFGLNAQMWTVQLPILRFGTQRQQEAYLPPLSDGSMVAAQAMTEPQAGSDVFALQTIARPTGDNGYILNGRKCLITLAPIADVILLFATINPDAGKWGVTAFLIDRDLPGLTLRESQQKMGLRTVPVGEVELNDCFVPASQRLGAEGGGFALSNYALEFERCCIFASQLGAMERQLNESVRYAKQRTQFGQPIGKFQSISNRIADMKTRIETARLLLYRAAWLKQHDRSAMLEAAMLKLYLSEAFVDSSVDALRIHGGRGYLTESGVERDVRDAFGGVLYGGTSDIQRNIISGLLGL